MSKKIDVIYFSVNNWFRGRDYPNTENFKKFMESNQFQNNDWAKENKLCVYCGVIDMSLNYTISAPRDWIEKNCPELLTDEEYTYSLVYYGSDGKKEVETLTKKYSDFLDFPREDNSVVDHRFGWPYLDYCEENFGCHYYEEQEEEDEDDEDE